MRDAVGHCGCRELRPVAESDVARRKRRVQCEKYDAGGGGRRRIGRAASYDACFFGRIRMPPYAGAPIRSQKSGRMAQNLPRNAMPIVGREREIASTVEALHGSHLVTISGAGGIGKTRLAVEVAHVT